MGLDMGNGQEHMAENTRVLLLVLEKGSTGLRNPPCYLLEVSDRLWRTYLGGHQTEKISIGRCHVREFPYMEGLLCKPQCTN